MRIEELTLCRLGAKQATYSSTSYTGEAGWLGKRRGEMEADAN